MLKIGKEVPDIELEAFHNEETKKIRLSDYKGKWLVLIFYPADFTFICPTELEEAAEYYEEFKKLDAEILSISTDTVFALKACEIHDNSIGRNTKELLRKVQAARFVRNNKGQVCPVSWEPGKKTLKPGLDLVGKI